MPIITFVGGTTADNDTTDTITYSASLTGLTGGIASAPAQNDIVVIVSGWATFADEVPYIDTAGYTAAHTDLYANDNNDSNMGVFYKVMGVTPDTAVVIGGVGSNSFGSAAAIHVWRYVDTSTPLDVTPTTATGINSNLADSPSITPTTAGVVILACGLGARGGSIISDFVTPTGMENGFVRTGTGTNTSCRVGIASHRPATVSAYNPAAFTGVDATTDSWAASTIALRPATAGFGSDARPTIFVMT